MLLHSDLNGHLGIGSAHLIEELLGIADLDELRRRRLFFAFAFSCLREHV
jgi:hypothetical protein